MIWAADPMPDAEGTARAALYTAVFTGVVALVGAAGTLYSLFKRERRTDTATEDEREIRLAAAWKKAWQEAIDRLGKEQARWAQERERLEADRDRLERRLDECERAEQQCRRDVAWLKKEVRRLGGDPGTDEHVALHDDGDK